MPNLGIVLTARMSSERLPGKAMMDVAGKPLTYWVAARLARIGDLVIATTTDKEDDAFLEIGRSLCVPVFRGSRDDVVGRIEGARAQYIPKCDFVLRALGDCPFIATELVERAVRVMDMRRAEAFVWYLAPYCWPVYGAREFPYYVSGWKRIVEHAQEREHVDNFFHQNRGLFDVVYHAHPQNVYFRPYRLEVDWEEDLEMVREVANGVGMMASLTQVIKFLDENRDVSLINQQRVERTGPTTSFEYETHRTWVDLMQGQPVVGWDDKVWEPPSSRAVPIFCQSGHLLGYSHNNVVYTKNAVIKGEAILKCDCGSDRVWNVKGKGIGVAKSRGYSEILTGSHAYAR
jgi:spore coat polysaccharide biosynthesis protein SpsF